MNPLGVHFLPTHQGQFHYDFIRDMQPGIFKLVGSSTPDVQQIADGYATAPNALMYLRNVARSEQHDFLWREPVRAAKQHVAEWHADIQERYHQARERGLTIPDIGQIRILGVNEPVIELFPRQEDMSNYDEWLAMMMQRTPILDTYMVEFGLEANRLGYGAGLGNISSGQPANKKPGEYATFDWFPKTRKLLESTRGKNAYTAHEYWRAESGPEGHADWHAWRFMHLNVDCDIDILESGVDQYIVKDKEPIYPRGWHGHDGLDAAAYVDQHRRYIERARTDSRYRCSTPFTLDGDKIWESFYIEYCVPEMLALSSQLRTSQPPTQPTPIPQPEPPIVAYVIAPAGARLRAAPTTQSETVAIAPFGAQVAVTDFEGTDSGRWFASRYQGTDGWIRGDLLGLEPPSQPEQPQKPGEPQPTPSGNCWERAWPIVLDIEGELSLDPNDSGNYYNGKLIGTKYGISAASWGGQYDIPNLTKEQALAIYREHYFEESGAADLDWPMCLLHFDAYVQNEVAAKEFLQASNGDPDLYLAERIDWYTRAKTWDHHGRGWMRRCATMLREVAKAKASQ